MINTATKNKFINESFIDYIWIIFGNLLISLAISFFILPRNILSGGVSGVINLVNSVISLDKTLSTQLLMVALFLAGTIILGKEFFLKTLISSITSPIMIGILVNVYEVFSSHLKNMDLLTCTILTGLLLGLGIAIVYKRNGSTGGMDIIPLIINKYTGLPLSKLVLLVDGITVLLGIYLFGLRAAIYGIISVILCSIVIKYYSQFTQDT